MGVLTIKDDNVEWVNEKYCNLWWNGNEFYEDVETGAEINYVPHVKEPVYFYSAEEAEKEVPFLKKYGVQNFRQLDYNLLRKEYKAIMVYPLTNPIYSWCQKINPKTPTLTFLSYSQDSLNPENKVGGFSLEPKADRYIREGLEYKKDPVQKKIMNDEITECALYLKKNKGDPCMRDETLKKIGDSYGVKGENSKEILEKLKEKTGCETERCVLKSSTGKIGRGVVDNEIKMVMKITGPTDTQLLSNFDIDHTLQQWSYHWKDFYPYTFNMKDYAKYSFRDGRVINQPDTLATVSVSDIFNTGARCAGCVINTDVYRGKGKHWMALFLDARGDKRWTVEFFNSSANHPSMEWLDWMNKMVGQLEEYANGIPIQKIISCKFKQQHSRSECGVYSLYYIYARLCGVKPEYFTMEKVPDTLMFEFRQHLFNDNKDVDNAKFDLLEFARRSNIKWE